MPYYERYNLSFHELINNNICPICGNQLIPEGRCKYCVTGDWSAC
jgi:ribosomal protein L32